MNVDLAAGLPGPGAASASGASRVKAGSPSARRVGDDRAPVVAVWLFTIAALVMAMVVVGGATRLTGSGLSITEWRPVTGAVPPLNDAAWLGEFAKYQKIPQYRFVNAGMSLGAFKTLYYWEWGHRLLARLVGFSILAPLAVLLWTRRIPRRLIPRAVLLLGLVAFEGFIGWWMVASGLEARVSVAPERLATHLLTALTIFSIAVWTGLEALYGKNPATDASREKIGPPLLVGLAFLQILLGALVAGNKAGQVYTDWPMMGGRFLPSDYAPPGMGLWDVIAHNAASVQFNHRTTGYLLFFTGLAYAARCLTAERIPGEVRGLAALLAGLLTLQVGLGVVTLIYGAPVLLGLVHQTGAVIVLAAALALAWRARRGFSGIIIPLIESHA